MQPSGGFDLFGRQSIARLDGAVAVNRIPQALEPGGTRFRGTQSA